MKISEFRRAVDEEFGETHGRVLVNELVIDVLDGRTAARALDEGVPAADVWGALCKANDVPPERWHGRGREVARSRR
ncbi:MAG TPA: DUF3046 domain-containing protein [Amnibacterium sp.]|jgi:hypothetical protein|uniref:DUF3046 domain-containing protein n=1 Tax=Amnibacterium sp. TaxID=1872496 RepID=UPI002F92CA5D